MSIVTLNFRKLVFPTLALNLLCGAAALAQDAPDPADAAAADPTEPTDTVRVSDPEAQFHIMTGEMAANRGQPGLAATEFLAALKTVPDAALAARATGLAINAGNGALLELTARRWLEIEPNNMDPREVILQLGLQRGDAEETYTQADAIINGHAGGRDDGFHHVALLMAQQPGKPDTALAVLKRLTDQYPKESGAYYATALVTLRYDQVDAAEAAAREAVRLKPDSKENSLLLIGVLVKQKKLDEADVAMDGLAKRNKKESGDLRLAFAKLLLESNERERARTQLEKIIKDNPKNEDALYALAVFNANDGKLDQAKKQFQALTKSKDRGSDAHFQLGRIDERQKNFEEALSEYKQVSGGAQALDAAVRRAAVLAQLGRTGEAREMLAEMRAQFPPLAPRLRLAEGEILLEAGKPEESLAAYNDALRDNPTDPDLLYGRSLVYDRLGKQAESEADLRAIIKAKPDDARALNALGYLLTLDGKAERLPEAQELITKALKIDPDDSAIIDSMGWIKHKLGQNEDARGYLQKAYDKTPDPEIAAHLGEVLWVLGQRDEARAVWTRALADSPGHKAVTETMQRLNP
jgi:tetratricopeptide (TPR) repeat protein